MEMIILRLYFNKSGLRNQLGSHYARVSDYQGFRKPAISSAGHKASAVVEMGMEIGRAGRQVLQMSANQSCAPGPAGLPAATLTLPDSSHLHLDVAGLWQQGRVWLLVRLCGTPGVSLLFLTKHCCTSTTASELEKRGDFHSVRKTARSGMISNLHCFGILGKLTRWTGKYKYISLFRKVQVNI